VIDAASSTHGDGFSLPAKNTGWRLDTLGSPLPPSHAAWNALVMGAGSGGAIGPGGAMAGDVLLLMAGQGLTELAR
jgi:hypothetical protein